MLKRMTRSSKETYREQRRRANKLRKEKRDVKETNRKYRSGMGKSGHREILSNCESVQERISTLSECL